MKNKLLKRIFSYAMCLVLMGSICLPAKALEVPDLNRKGSVTVRMHYENTAIPGGELTLYQVADVDGTDNNYTFRLTGDFADYTGSITDFDSADSIQSMENYIAANNIHGITALIDDKGKVVFSDLEIGLYFAVQNKSAEGYYPATSFFVSLPVKENDVYVYDVNATPKTALEKKPVETPPPPQIPETGVSEWKVPAFAVSGVLIFALGWCLFRKGSQNG